MSDTDVIKTYSTSKCTLFKVQHFWKIDNFSFVGKEELTSTIFSGVANGKTIQWQIKARVGDYQDNLSLFLHQVSRNDESLKVKGSVKFAILNKMGQWYNVKSFEQPNKMLHPIASNIKLGSDSWFYLSDIQRNNCLTNDCLTIVAEVVGLADKWIVTGDDGYTPFETTGLAVWENFGSLLQTKRFSDVILVVGGQQYSAHKAILASRSSVFDKMFEHEMKESRENRVEIRDFTPEVIHEMLQFIYTGTSRKLNHMAGDLLVAAEKYALETLKVMCEKILFANLTVENAAKMLILADLYNAKPLKTATIKYINAGRIASVMETKGWKDMVKKQPHLVNEAFRATVK